MFANILIWVIPSGSPGRAISADCFLENMLAVQSGEHGAIPRMSECSEM